MTASSSDQHRIFPHLGRAAARAGDNRAASSALKCCLGMMTRTQLHARTGAAAIAAVLALSSTQIVAQEAASAGHDRACHDHAGAASSRSRRLIR